MDVLQRRAVARGIPYYELTASVFSGMSMLLNRGRLVQAEDDPQEQIVKEKEAELVDPTYVASYVPRKRTYTAGKFIRTLAYFRTRAVALKAVSWLQRDPLIPFRTSFGDKDAPARPHQVGIKPVFPCNHFGVQDHRIEDILACIPSARWQTCRIYQSGKSQCSRSEGHRKVWC